jgi:chemotaxis protein CheD
MNMLATLMTEPDCLRRITVLQGEVHVSADPSVELTTVLGSCVSTCLYDPVARIGGMNHFLLAEPPAHQKDMTFDEHYGVFLMELLVNRMIGEGAVKSRFRARLYGGANMHRGGQSIGSVNAAFARSFLERERILIAFADLGGDAARRVHLRPASGQVRCRTVAASKAPATQTFLRPERASGDVEFF